MIRAHPGAVCDLGRPWILKEHTRSSNHDMTAAAFLKEPENKNCVRKQIIKLENKDLLLQNKKCRVSVLFPNSDLEILGILLLLNQEENGRSHAKSY